jgi:YggT family protein
VAWRLRPCVLVITFAVNWFPSSIRARQQEGAVMQSVLMLISTVISLYIWCLILQAILSWLVAFNVINTSNRFVYMVGDFLYRITEPALRPIRAILPNMGGIDLSPVVLILLLSFLKSLMFELFAQMMY